MSSGQNMFTKGQTSELAWVTSSNIPSPLKWFLGPFLDFASSLYVVVAVGVVLLQESGQITMVTPAGTSLTPDRKLSNQVSV